LSPVTTIPPMPENLKVWRKRSKSKVKNKKATIKINYNFKCWNVATIELLYLRHENCASIR
jgi:hypothetical protein